MAYAGRGGPRVELVWRMEGMNTETYAQLFAGISLALSAAGGHAVGVPTESLGKGNKADATPMAFEAGAVVARLTPTEADFRAVLVRWKKTQRQKGDADRHIEDGSRWLAKQAERFSWSRYTDVKPEHCRDIFDDMMAEGKEPRTRNTRRSYLNCFLRYWRNELEAGDPMLKLPDPIRAIPTAKVLEKDATYTPNEAEVIALIMEAKKRQRQKRDRWVVYLLAATTGIRHGVCKKLRWEHVFEAADPPHLKLPAWIQKNRRKAVVWLPNETALALADLRRRMTPLSDDPVFESVPKAHSFNADLRAAGLEKNRGDQGNFSFRSLRHFSSNRMEWQKPFTQAERQRQNTHETAAMTQNVYTKRDHVDLGRKVAQMPGLLQENSRAQPPPFNEPALSSEKSGSQDLEKESRIADDVGGDHEGNINKSSGHAKAERSGLHGRQTSVGAERRVRDRVFSGRSVDQRISGLKNRVSGSNPVTLILSPVRVFEVVERLLGILENALEDGRPEGLDRGADNCDDGGDGERRGQSGSGGR